MSNFIPMVSSSPPPLEDTGGFDDWGDDDEFGGFMGADSWNNSQITDSKPEDQINANVTKTLPQTILSDIQNIENCKNRSPLSLDLEKVSHSTANISENILENNSQNDQKLTQGKTLDNLSGNSTGDSGLFDVSPVPVSEDTKSNNSDDSPDTFQDSSDDIPASNIVFDSAGLQSEQTYSVENEALTDDSNVLPSQSVENEVLTKDDDVSPSQSVENEVLTKDDGVLPSQSAENEVLTEDDGVSPSQSVENEAVTVDSNVISPSQTHQVENDSHCSAEGDDKIEAESGAKESDNDKSCTLNMESLTDNKTLSSQIEESSEVCGNIDNNTHLPKESSHLSEAVASSAGSDLTTGVADTCNETRDSDTFKIDTLETPKEGSDNISVDICDSIVCSDDDFADFSSVNTKVEVEASEVTLDDNNESSSVHTDERDIEGDSTTPEIKESENLGQNLESDEEFADFSAATIIKNNKELATMEDKGVSESSFANFDTNIEDDFGDFDSVQCIEIKNTTPSVNSSASDVKELTLASSHSQEQVVKETLSKQINEDDDFADFATAGKIADEEEFANFKSSEQTEQVSSDVHFDSDDDFADFSSAPKSDDFEDFKSTEDNSEKQSTTEHAPDESDWATFKQTTIPSKTENSHYIQKEPVGSMLTKCFQDTGQSFQETTDLDDAVEEDHSQLWGTLQKVDNTAFLKWPQFSSNKNLFVSLKIDTKNILLGHKKPTVPIYAANLTLLEPTKGSPALLQPDVPLVDTNKQDEIKDLPPVQFDWTTSGLTNPLEVNSKLQHLDFLTVDESELSGKSKAFDSELIHGQRPTMQPLQNILANLKVNKKTRLEDLSNEAGRVISHLPDLSFMKAKVLMFPLKQNSS